MKPSEVYPLLGEAAQAGGPLYGPAYQEAIRAQGIDPQAGPEWYLLVVSFDFEPETTSAARFAARTPYANPRNFADGLAGLAERGLLAPAGDDTYRITDQGHAAIDGALTVLHDRLRELEPLPIADVTRLVELLNRVVEAALSAAEPAEKPLLKYNRSSDPGPDGPPMLRFLQAMADLASFRDDVHMAAWRPQGVSGQAFEALTLLWRGEAHTAAELAEKLPNRNYTAEDYTAALGELEVQGWIEPVAGTPGAFQLTETGKNMRQAVEDRTDALFYGPWVVLSQAELDELARLLTQLRDSLKAMQPATA